MGLPRLPPRRYYIARVTETHIVSARSAASARRHVEAQLAMPRRPPKRGGTLAWRHLTLRAAAIESMARIITTVITTVIAIDCRPMGGLTRRTTRRNNRSNREETE